MPFQSERDQLLEQFLVGDAEASKSLAYTLVAVKPGIVFSSLTSTSPSARTKQSARAMPSHSVARKAATESLADLSLASGEMRGGTISSIPPSSYFAE